MSREPLWNVNFSGIVSVSVRAPDEDAALAEAIGTLKWADLANHDGTGIFFLRDYSHIVVTRGDVYGDWDEPQKEEA